MTCSPARLLSNQANAKRSTGPRTPRGRARSALNATKHGLAGQGLALPDEDAAEVARRFEALQSELAPSGDMGRILVQRVAFFSLRLERCAEHEAASLSVKIRHAEDDYDEQRYVEVAALLDGLADSPATNARRLLRTPEGVDATIRAWLDLKADLAKSNARRWTAAHCERANNLTGRRMDEIPISRINELSHAIWGDFGLLEDHEGAGLDEEGRQAWARERMAELIDQEVAYLNEYRETLDLEAFELDREEAGQRALFDPSKEATLARRYEAAAERGLFRALREYRKVEREAAENPQPAQAQAPEPLGSFGAGDVGPLGSFGAEPEPPAEEEVEAESEVEMAPPAPPVRRPRVCLPPISTDREPGRSTGPGAGGPDVLRIDR